MRTNEMREGTRENKRNEGQRLITRDAALGNKHVDASKSCNFLIVDLRWSISFLFCAQCKSTHFRVIVKELPVSDRPNKLPCRLQSSFLFLINSLCVPSCAHEFARFCPLHAHVLLMSGADAGLILAAN